MRAWQALLIAILALVTSVATAKAQTVDITDEHGGLLVLYQQRWEKLAAQGVHVRVVGPCVSACTVLIGYIPRDNICVMPNAAFGFHWATVQFATAELWKTYPLDIRGWINTHGGLTEQLIWLQAPDIYQYFNKCRPERDRMTARP
jgi:hypothetical protein